MLVAFMISPYTGPGFQYDDPGEYLIAGPAADLLYLCLCGHSFGTPGATASALVAHAARACLARQAPDPGGYWLASRLVQQWGPDIWPAMNRDERVLWRL